MLMAEMPIGWMTDLVPGGGHAHPIPPRGPAYDAAMEWLRFHGIDSGIVPRGTEIVRDAKRCRIYYVGIVLDEDGKPVVDGCEARTESRIEQGEAPPLPFPKEITDAE